MLTQIDKKYDYSKLSNEVELFSKITQIETYVYLSEGVLLKGGGVFTSADDIQKNLSFKRTETLSIFPVIVNDDIFGCIICNATSVSQERINLTRTYLENIFNSVISEENNAHIQILNPLNEQSISRLRTLSLLFRPTLVGIKKEKSPSHGKNQVSELADNKTSIKCALDYINQNIKQPLSLESVSQNVFLSPSYLSKIFKRQLHVNFINHINMLKISLACKKLITTEEKVSTIAKQVGCSQTSYFSKVFKSLTGVTPLTYRRNNRSVEKIYTIPHDITWSDDDTVYDVSRRFFERHNIPYSVQIVNGYPYINQIGEFADSVNDRGWIYTIDCRQPTKSASTIPASNNSVIQWIYTAYN
ncbi:helix-turn-helix domain-containing protein [Lentilactobacillus raoultii]|uniref:Helix-turn-helix domain-containing protein n=1 Tax=Lentilactobacillus raoultii TaxID=1987503 RepID=A0ABW3PEE1_9LACO|nr:helix-turn-helix domain-containing protein [Lentilactobacillus raoultii]